VDVDDNCTWTRRWFIDTRLGWRKLSDVPGIGEEALIDEVHERLVKKYAHLSPDDVSSAVATALT
jgi:hypothetical protein